jgi:predicted TIM-barrel fold metal-dependent hydrolase
MRYIAIEEHFFPDDVGIGPSPVPQLKGQNHDRMSDWDAGRLADMDAGGIDMQVLSMPAWRIHDMEDGDEALRLCKKTNDTAHGAVTAHPDRFAAFAMVPTSQPDAAADELERAVSTLGFKGAMIPGHVRGRFLDDQFFWPIFERAEALDVPIYLTVKSPPEAVMQAYYSGFEPEVSHALAWAGWGWHCEAGLHSLRLILGGLFDRYPKLQIIIGHMGEYIPFGLDRIDWFMSGTAKHLERSVADYYRENFYINTSGWFSVPALQCALAAVGADRIMFAIDYPFADNAEGRAFLETAPISPADREKIAHGNAERLLRIPPVSG